MLKLTTVREVPFGATVHLVRSGEPTSTTYVRRAYDRSDRTYDLDSWDDINKQVFAKGSRLVFWDTDMPLTTNWGHYGGF
jgi:hypothetical protein